MLTENLCQALLPEDRTLSLIIPFSYSTQLFLQIASVKKKKNAFNIKVTIEFMEM